MSTTEHATLAIHSLPGPVAVLRDGLIAAHNGSFADWLGRPDAIGCSLAELFPGDVALDRLRREALSHGSAAEHHFARHGRDGTQSFWSIRAHRVEGGVLLWAVDITSFAQAAQAVHAAQRDHVALGAHELRGPLAAIKAWVGATDARRAAAEAAPSAGDGAYDALQVIGRQVDRMSYLVTDFLDVVRTDAAAVRGARRSIGVDELLQLAISESPVAGRVALTRSSGLGTSRRVIVDPLHVQSVMAKVLSYVAGRTVATAIDMGVELVSGDSDGTPREVHIAITDRGPLLARRAHGELFGRFARSSRPKETGLGLYACQQLVIANGGRVWLEQQDGGAWFIFAFPEDGRTSESGPRSGRNSAPSRRSMSSMHEPRTHVRVLFGEGDLDVLARAASVLRLQGHEVIAAPNGELFWSALDEGDLDAVFVDLSMPGVDGVQSLRRIRARPAAPRLVVVSSPSVERPDELMAAEREGAHAVIPKPFDWPHLLALVRSAAVARANELGGG